MSKDPTVQVDSKGRITLPKGIRNKAEIKEGDTFFVEIQQGQVKLTRAIKDPLVVLREHGRKEYKKSETKELRDYAKEKGIELDE